MQCFKTFRGVKCPKCPPPWLRAWLQLISNHDVKKVWERRYHAFTPHPWKAHNLAGGRRPELLQHSLKLLSSNLVVYVFDINKTFNQNLLMSENFVCSATARTKTTDKYTKVGWYSVRFSSRPRHFLLFFTGDEVIFSHLRMAKLQLMTRLLCRPSSFSE